jgi:Zn finger protein HypA/HybF involved in hydrogenase expression
MIRLTVSWLIFFYILFSVIVILFVWIIANYRERKEVALRDIDNIWKCSVCSNDYVDSKHEDISICPLCGSYNKKEQEKGVR